MLLLPIISTFLITLILGYAAFYMRPVLRNVVLIADAVILYSIINLHAISTIKDRAILFVISLLGILIGFIVAKSFQRKAPNTVAIMYIIALNFILFAPVISIFLQRYFAAMYVEKMSIIFAETVYFIAGKLILLLTGIAGTLTLFATIFASMDLKFSKRLTSVIQMFLIIFVVGALYLFSLKLNNTLYFYNNVVKETPSNLGNMRNLADHKGLIYMSRVTLEQITPLSKEHKRFHYNVASALLTTGLIGLTITTLLALRTKFKPD